MATMVILLTQEDITTRMQGTHIELLAKDGVVINFTPEALAEFVNDYYNLMGARGQIESTKQ